MIGRDVVVIEETEGDVYIESVMRLRPGSVIDICDHRTRAALVESWMVARLGRDGPVFRGICSWAAPTG